MFDERKAKDRVAMARVLVELAVEVGASAEIEDRARWSEREVAVRIEAPGGAYIQVILDGQSWMPNTFVETWNIVHVLPDVRFASAFEDVNQYHGRKATRVARDFDELCATLIRDIKACVAGTAYVPQP